MSKKQKTETAGKIRMSYPTYAFLKALVEQEKEALKKRFQSACFFIPDEPYIEGKPSGIDKAHKIFSKKYGELDVMLEELHAAAASTYADHPSPAMRKFWGVVDNPQEMIKQFP